MRRNKTIKHRFAPKYFPWFCSERRKVVLSCCLASGGNREVFLFIMIFAARER
jgi:hypothetical protein